MRTLKILTVLFAILLSSCATGQPAPTATPTVTTAEPLYAVFLRYDRTAYILGLLPEGSTEIDTDENYLIFVTKDIYNQLELGEQVAHDLTVITEGDQRGEISIPLPPIPPSVWMYDVYVADLFMVLQYAWLVPTDGPDVSMDTALTGIFPIEAFSELNGVYFLETPSTGRLMFTLTP